MKKKQVVGIAIAAVVIIITGVIGVAAVGIADGISSSISTIIGNVNSDTLPFEQYVGVVPIEGTIGSSPNYSRGEVVQGSPVDYIRQYAEDENNCAIMLYVESGGGSVFETDEIYLALMEYKQTTGRPVYAWCGSLVGSGAYYIACAADEIAVNRNCWAGSIGVYVQMTNFAELLEKLGIENEYIKTGDNKAMGSNMELLTDEQRAIYQSLVDDAFENFLAVVMAGRGYTREELLPIADGRVYTAAQALDNGLIDKIENLYSDYMNDILDKHGVEAFYMPAPTQLSYLQQLLGSMPKSDTQAALDAVSENESGVLMYKYVG